LTAPVAESFGRHGQIVGLPCDRHNGQYCASTVDRVSDQHDGITDEELGRPDDIDAARSAELVAMLSEHYDSGHCDTANHPRVLNKALNSAPPRLGDIRRNGENRRAAPAYGLAGASKASMN
jgi:hypothetical protein